MKKVVVNSSKSQSLVRQAEQRSEGVTGGGNSVVDSNEENQRQENIANNSSKSQSLVRQAEQQSEGATDGSVVDSNEGNQRQQNISDEIVSSFGEVCEQIRLFREDVLVYA